MDRRRFLPASEGMESRALMTAFFPTSSYTHQSGINSIFGYQLTSNVNIPITFQQKELRVEHLPFYIEQIRPGRYLPSAEMKTIQSDLLQIISTIHKPSTASLNNYNASLRPIVGKQSITAADAKTLNNNFGSVLTAASASPQLIDSLKSSVYKLVTQVDTASPQPAFLATNDYSLILQTALSIGRPMPPPSLPRIAKNQGIQANANHIKTSLRHPDLVGTYHFHTHVQVVTPSGDVVGTAVVRRNNNYKVRISTSLSPGVYSFRIRAYDTAGNLSRVSPVFEVKVQPGSSHAKK